MNLFHFHLSDESITSGFRKYRGRLLLFYAIILIPLTVFAFRIETDNAIERWLGDNDPSIQEFDQFRKTFGVLPQLTVIVENMSPTDDRISKYAERLESLSFVHAVWTPRRIADQMESIQNRSASSFDLLPKTPIGKFFVPNGHSTMLKIDLTTLAVQSSLECVETVQSIANTVGIPRENLHLGGPIVINAALDRQCRDSLKSLLPIVVVVCGLSLWFLVGRFWQSVLILFSSSLSVIATLGLMSFTGASLNLLSVALPPLIGVLHLSVGIHLLHQYNEASPIETNITAKNITTTISDDEIAMVTRNRRGEIPGNEIHALGYSIRKTLLPSLLAAFTTIIGMLSLMISDLLPVRSFGMWAAVGIVLSLMIAYSFVPCFLLGSKSMLGRPLRCRWISPAFRKTRVAIFAVSIGLLAISLFGWTQLKPEFNAISFLAENSRTMRDYRWIESHCCGLVPVEFVINLNDKTDFMARKDRIQFYSERIESHPAVTHALGIHYFLPTVRGSSSSTADGLIDLNADVFENGNTLEHWVSSDGNTYRISALVRSDYPEEFGKLTEELRTRVSDVPVKITGLISLIDRSQHAIYSSLRDSLILACVLIGLLLMIVLRSISAGLIVLIPNILPIIVGFGLISWMGIPLDVGTVVTASIALGIALDDSLHFLHHFRCVANSSRCVGKSVRRAWQVCSWPMYQTSCVAVVGFLVLIPSSFRPISHFGGLMVTMLSLALAADLVLLPYLLTTPLSRLFRKPA